MFVNFKKILTFSLIIICFGCKNDDTNKVRKPNYDGKPINSEDTTSILDPDEFYPDEFDSDESGPIYGDKSVEWSDGNTYTYDYTEQMEIKDTAGTKIVTVFMRNKPKYFDCDIKKCKWCAIEMRPQGYTFEEFPNLDIWRGKESGLSNGFFSSIQLALSIATDKQYWDLKNDRIRTEWTVDCDYGGPNGFCSLKCKSEYNNR